MSDDDTPRSLSDDPLLSGVDAPIVCGHAVATERVIREHLAAAEARILELDLAARFTAEGRSWVELDDNGRVVRRHPDGRSDVLPIDDDLMP